MPAENRILDRLREAAEAVRDEPDRRVLHLVDWVREHMLEGDGKGADFPDATRPRSTAATGRFPGL